ncbi:MAG TPA: class I SAM-dependent methyltransferase [Vicinamibacterales bacterium]|jgi:ubiquinone/menaquinone biosynthesis C-methylase UbiE|nr:class I SAM-dependent methyltransferase [Vicinamibacterales bacterium]
MGPERAYLPAAGHDVFLPFYDPIMRLFGGHAALRRLIDQAALRPRCAVLDVGCGTGTLAVLIGRVHPGVDVIGVDPDPKALARAERKAARARVAVRFERAFADALPFADGAFDRVFSSMMFHHVPKEDKAGALADIRRVIRPGGRLEFLDLAGGSHGMLARLIHGTHVSAGPDPDDRLINRMRESGFVDAKRIAVHGTIVGPIAFYQASVPAS